jgi:hypothetical protein
MPTLRSQLNNLASSFADSVLQAIKGASLEELLTEGNVRGGGNGRAPRSSPKTTPKAAPAAAKGARSSRRLPRRSAEDIQQSLEEVAGLLKKHPDGLRAEQIRAELGMEAKEMPRILKQGLSSKALKSKGQKRATTYFAK